MLKKYWKSIGWAALIIWTSLIKLKNIDKIPDIIIPYFDKIIHFSMYAVFVFLLMLESKLVKLELSERVARIFVFSVLFGGIIEVLQNYIPTGRKTDIFDFLANFAGIVMGLIVFLKVKQLKAKFID